MAKIIEIRKDKEPNVYGNTTLSIQVEVEEEVFSFKHSCYHDMWYKHDFKDYIMKQAKDHIGREIVAKLLPNL